MAADKEFKLSSEQWVFTVLADVQFTTHKLQLAVTCLKRHLCRFFVLSRGSGAALDGSFWLPYFNLPPGYRPFGSFAARGSYANATSALQSWGPVFVGRPASDPALFAAPVDFVEVYRDVVSGINSSYVCYFDTKVVCRCKALEGWEEWEKARYTRRP